MTEPLDPTGPTVPDDGSSTEAADRAWFHAQVDPVVDAAADPADRWAELAAAAGTHTPVALADRRPRSRALALGAAAVVIALVAFAAVVALTSPDDDAEPVATVPDGPTGWYVPVGLPDGWKVESVLAYPGQEKCERRGFQWTDPAGQRSIGLSFDGCGRAPTAEDVPDLSIPGAPPDTIPPMASLVESNLGPDLTGTSVQMGQDDGTNVNVDRSLSWNADGGAWTVAGIGLTYDELVEAASVMTTDLSDPELPATDLLAGGLELVDRWSAPARDRSPEVQVGLINPDGLRTSYNLSLPGDGMRPAGNSVLIPRSVEGQPNPVFRYEPRTFWAGRYGGYWPGADLIFFRWTEELTDSEHLISDEGMEQLIGALRPATAGEWRQFLATATGTVSPVLLEAESLGDLGATDFERPGEPDPDGTTTTAAPEEPTTTTEPDEPADTRPVESEPATAPVEDGTVDISNYSDLTGLRIRLRLSSASIGVTESTPAALVFENTTDETIVVNECSSLLTTWGLVPADDPAGELPDRTIIDCYDTPTVTIAGGETGIMPLEWGPTESGFTARGLLDAAPGLEQMGATLPAGDYLAVARIPTSNGEVQLTIPVTIADPPCPMTEEEATRYRLPYGEAAAAVTSDGRSLVPVVVDGELRGTGWDLRCDRVRAVVMDDQVIDYTFG